MILPVETGWQHYFRLHPTTLSGVFYQRLRRVAKPGVGLNVNEVRRIVRPEDVPGYPTDPQRGKGTPEGWFDWYDWALVWRYWIGEAHELRRPYLLEIAELLRLGSDLNNVELAARLGFSERQVIRWRKRLALD